MAYATLQDIFQRWGEMNVRDAANVGSDNLKSSKVTKRINYFLQLQSEEIDGMLLGCPYKVPFDPVPLVIRNLCAEMTYIAMYRIRHSQDNTGTDPFASVTAGHARLFADIHARRFRLGMVKQSINIPAVIGGKPYTVTTTVTTKEPEEMTNLAKVYTDGTLQGDGTENNPLSVVNHDVTIDLHGIDVTHLSDCSFVAIGGDGFVEADLQHAKVVGFKVGNTILTQGIVQNNQWDWEPGKYVMLGQDGLTQTVGETLIRVGIALSPTLIMLKFEYGFL